MEAFISSERAAEQLCVTARTVRRWAKDGRITGAVYHAKAWHIPEAEARRPHAWTPPVGIEHELYRAAVALVDQLGNSHRVPRRLERATADLRAAIQSYEWVRGELARTPTSA